MSCGEVDLKSSHPVKVMIVELRGHIKTSYIIKQKSTPSTLQEKNTEATVFYKKAF